MRTVAIIGGGLAGLISGIQLARAGIPCRIFEKKSYPFHRVCGEYISNEALPFLERSKLFPGEFFPPRIDRLLLSSVSGKSATLKLDLGGFGISRFSFDNFLYEKALALGVEFSLGSEVTRATFQQDKFSVITDHDHYLADVAIGAFGKRSRMDNALDRSFIRKRSPFAGIKYHIRTDHPANTIALHNFPGGYCGVSNVEGGITNLCYLVHRDSLRASGDIPTLEREVLFRNPLLRYMFNNADFVFTRPEVINEISFETKSPVSGGILMAGDAAGMIAPLCGNGMAMAIHAAKILSDIVIAFATHKISRKEMENSYAAEWTRTFSKRLWKGRQIQQLFGSGIFSGFAVDLALFSTPVANIIVRNTHGEAF